MQVADHPPWAGRLAGADEEKLRLLLRDAPAADFGTVSLEADCGGAGPGYNWPSVLGGWFRYLKEATVPLQLAPAMVSSRDSETRTI